MPKVTHPDKNTYIYNCTCGAEITFITDMPVKRLIKCFQCGKKDEVDWLEKQRSVKNADIGNK